jgi:hypothetical protein
MNNSRSQGSELAAISCVDVLVLLVVIGYIAWNNFFDVKNTNTNVPETSQSTDGQVEEVEHKTVQINERTFRYPLNKNNEKIVIVPDESTPALQISYGPIRNYYSNKTGEQYEYCKDYIAGLVNVNTEKDFSDYNLLPRFHGNATFAEALADGTIVQVGDRDLYLSGPTKQNEGCTDIYESKDSELLNILSDMSNVRLAWLKSLELIE